MFFSKNGLKVNLDFKNSIDEKELSNLEKNNNNKTLHYYIEIISLYN